MTDDPLPNRSPLVIKKPCGGLRTGLAHVVYSGALGPQQSRRGSCVEQELSHACASAPAACPVGCPWVEHAFPGSREEDLAFAPSRNNHPMISWASKARPPPSRHRAGYPP